MYMTWEIVSLFFFAFFFFLHSNLKVKKKKTSQFLILETKDIRSNTRLGNSKEGKIYMLLITSKYSLQQTIPENVREPK